MLRRDRSRGYTARVRKVSAKRLLFIAGRLLLAVSLVFSTGAWASLGAVGSTGACDHLSAETGSGSHPDHAEFDDHGGSDGAERAHGQVDRMACCDDSGMETCLSDSDSCSAACEAVCGAYWQVALAATTGASVRLGGEALVSAFAQGNPSPRLPRVMRPPISA